MNAQSAARGLGWFSIGLGLAEVAATRSLARAVKMEQRHGLLRLFGVREMATGVGILTRQQRAPWLWARVAGDVMDLAALGTAFAKNKGNRGRAALAVAAVAGVTALDVICGRLLSRRQRV